MKNKAKKIILIVVIVVVLIGAGGGAWYYFSQRNAEPVYVFPFEYVGMTEYWGESQESYGPVSTDKMQTVYLSNTQTVTEILVSLGDTVKKGQILVILEAMKMENEIVSPVDGTVTFVGVSKGATVESGSPICVIE